MFEIVRFELKYRLGRPATYIYFAIMFLLAFLSVTTDVVQIGGGVGQVKENAPTTIATMMVILSALPGMLLVSAIMGVPVLRDYEHQTASMIFTTPITKFQYLSGRFIGSFLVALFVYSGMLFGFAIGHLMPWLEPENLMPYNLWFYVQPFLFFAIPNLLVLSGIFFMGGALSKKMLIVYTQGALLLVAYLVGVNMIRDLENQTLAALLDPFGFNTNAVTTQYWTVAEQNSQTIPLSGLMLTNRLIWLGIGLLSLIATYVFFNFNLAGNARRRHKKLAAPNGETRLQKSEVTLPVVQQFSGFGTHLKQTFQLSIFYFKWLIRQIPFIAILVAGMALLLVSAIDWNETYGVDTLPTTYSMIELINGQFGLFYLIIIVFYTGELIWQEREVRINLIYDALPYPNFVTLVGKFLALIYAFIGLMFLLTLVGIFIQTVNGYTHYELGIYLKSLLGESMSYILLYIFLGFFLHTIVNQKFLGHAAFVMFFIAILVMDQLGLEHGLFQFAEHSLGTYSDMNTFGHYVPRFSWYSLYWFGLALVLFIVALLFSVRGAETVMKMRWRLSKSRFTRPVVTLGLLALVTFIGSGSYIYYNTNVQNKYRNSDANNKLQADYEKTLRQYQDILQPKIVDTYVEVDILPESRDFNAKGYFILKNKWDEPIKEIHIQHSADDQITSKVDFAVKAGINKSYDPFKYQIYELENALQPGDSIRMNFEVNFRTDGFVERGSNTEVLYNGTFFNNSYFPTLGYSEDYELGSDNDRREQDLEPKERARDREDPVGLRMHALGDDADFIRFETILSTSPDQIAIAPGYLQREWSENGRRYFHYKMDKPMHNFYSIISARYEVMRDKWVSPEGQEVKLEIYYHKEHDQNLDRMMEGMKLSLDYFSKNFSPYQYQQVRIMEFPRYRSFAQSFANTIPFSEDIGFIMNIGEDDIDMPFYVTCHEVGHQWWAHQVVPANVKGGTMIVETFAQYSALMVMKHQYPPEMMQKFMEFELDSYLRGRTTETKKEQPLALVENQPYIHYRKGSLVMFALQDYISEDSVNVAMQRCIRDWAFKEGPYITTKEMLDYFREVTPDSLQYIIEDMFETITLYENRATDATFEEQNGRYKVTIDIEAIKYRADSLGNERKIPINDWIDIGVLSQDDKGKDKILYLQKHKIDKEKQQFEIYVDEKPVKAGIDPINKLVDRNPDDNTKRVTAKTDS